MNNIASSSPALQTSQWFNSPMPVGLSGLLGRVVVMHSFQMLCPGCVSHGLPQAMRVHRSFPQDRLAVIGLHTVFEHHNVMGPEALRVFLHEYGIEFPVGVDQADTGGTVPLTMQAYGLRGTPSVVVFDSQGRMRLNHFGQIDDLQLGAVIGQLLAEATAHEPADGAESVVGARCDGSDATCAGGVCSVDA